MLTNKTEDIDGTYIISDNGKTITKGSTSVKVSNKWTLPKTRTEDTEYNMFDDCGTDHVTVR